MENNILNKIKQIMPKIPPKIKNDKICWIQLDTAIGKHAKKDASASKVSFCVDL